MKYLIYLSILLIACGTTQQTTGTGCPTCPACATCPPPTEKLDSVPYPVYIQHDNPVTLNVTQVPILPGMIILTANGNDHQQLQDAINWNIANPAGIIFLDPSGGAFINSSPLLAVNLINGIYGQVKITMKGPVSARNAVYSAQIKCMYDSCFGLGIQNGKECDIENINWIGAYHFTDDGNLTVGQIDTLTFAQWPGGTGSSRTSPYCGVCIDPFSDPKDYDGIHYKKYRGFEGYYIPGMQQSGSTGVNVHDCQITGFEVGEMVTPSYQANGELCNTTHDRIDHCKVAYAYSQAQSKANLLEDLMVWGNTFYAVDGVDYGFPRGDGSTAPTMRHFNVAGFNHALFHLTAQTFSILADDIYAENIYEIGMVEQGTAGVSFNFFQINFQDGGDNTPSPPFYYFGQNTVWTGGYLRIYNNDPNTRIIMNSLDNYFMGTGFGSPPIGATLNPSQGPPTFVHSKMQVNNQMLNSNGYDSLVYIGRLPIYVDKTTFTGYFITTSATAGGNDSYTTPDNFKDYPAQGSQVSPLGYGIGRSGDTIFLKQIGQDIQSGQLVDVYDCKIKTVWP